MKTPSLKSVVVFVSVLFANLLLAGCLKYDETGPIEPEDEGTRAIKQRSLEGAVYHEQTGSWLLPQADPYAIENIRQAYNNLAAGKSKQKFADPGVAKEFLTRRQLLPTHYTLKIFPRNEDELGKIEMMRDVTISYLPFDHTALTMKENKTLNSYGRKAAAALPDERRYTVTYTDIQTTDGPVPDETFTMPVLYVVWPYDKQLPEELDYEITSEVLLIHSLQDVNSKSSARSRASGAATLSIEALGMLQNEAIALAFPDIGPGIPVLVRLVTATVTQDDSRRGDVPLHNLKVRFELGSSIWDFYTNAEGSITLTIGGSPGIPYQALMYHLFQRDGQWKITDDSENVAYYYFGAVADRWTGTTHWSYTYPTSTSEAVIHRAVNFFYYGDHYIPKEVYRSGIQIIASSNASEEANGRFYVYPAGGAYIRIYNNNAANNARKIGTTLHELGHMAQYNRGTYFGFLATDDILLESWASYVSWHIGEEYYKSIGWVKLSPDSDITGNARQGWRWDDKNYSDLYSYSPLFVDLIDDYNQRNIIGGHGGYYTYYPNDGIVMTGSAVHSHILYVADNFMGLDNAIDYLRDYLPYDNQYGLDKYLDYYED